ncbi:MAG: M1 family peptidase, partial [Cyclobacteriaceae bacterium]
WYRLETDKSRLENKGVRSQQGDLAGSSADAQNEDFSQGPQPLRLLKTDPRFYGEFLSRVEDQEIMARLQNKNIYEVTISNKGGLVMPVVIEWTYKDGTIELEKIPAEIWRLNESRVTKVFVKEKEVINIMIDPGMETADINIEDNFFPKIQQPSRFDEFRNKSR